jgi:hypothetical protein
MIFFIAVMVWVGGIFVTSDPRTRIDRSCLPVTFADSILVAVVQMIHEPYAMSTHQMMLSLEYGCKFTVWKTFYEKRELESMADQTRNISNTKPPTEAPRSVEQQKTPSSTTLKAPEKKEQASDAPVTAKPLPRYLESK